MLEKFDEGIILQLEEVFVAEGAQLGIQHDDLALRVDLCHSLGHRLLVVLLSVIYDVGVCIVLALIHGMTLSEFYDDRVLMRFFTLWLWLLLLLIEQVVGVVQDVAARVDLAEGSFRHALADFEPVVEHEASQFEYDWDAHA